jgi:hypothetical protein
MIGLMAPDHAAVVVRQGAALLAADGKGGEEMSIFPTKILLLTVAVLTAVLPTLVAQRWFAAPEAADR